MRRFADILAEVSRASGIPEERLIDGRRDRGPLKWKYFFCWKLRQETILSTRQIAALCNLKSLSGVTRRANEFEEALQSRKHWALRMRSQTGVVPAWQEPHYPPVSAEDVIDRVCSKYDITKKELLSGQIAPNHVAARHEAIIVLRFGGVHPKQIAAMLNRKPWMIWKVLRDHKQKKAELSVNRSKLQFLHMDAAQYNTRVNN